MKVLEEKLNNLKKIIALLIVIYCSNLFAQSNQPVQLTQYVFNVFTDGVVKMKSGETFNQKLNYNILTDEMIFDNNGQYLAIAEPQNVNAVYINNRKFIPLNNKFYEVLIDANAPLLLEFTYTVSEPGASVGYGASSNTSAAQSLKSLINTGGAYQLKLPDDFKVIPGYTYWINKDGSLQKFSNAKQFAKIYPDKKDAINDYVKKNDTNFSKRDDVINLVKEIDQ